MTTHREFIAGLLGQGIPETTLLADLQAWQRAFADLPATVLPLDKVIRMAGRVDRLAFAFAAGYQGALQSLFPMLGPDTVAALCVTEAGGNRPGQMATCLHRAGAEWRLDGTKTFVTGATVADCLLVAATTGVDDAGRKRLQVVLVDRNAGGVSLEPLPELPFVPEISHAVARFEGVVVDPARILPGDGYADYVKPFRTVEDIHVSAATLGYLYGAARRYQWSPPIVEQLLLCLATARELATWPPAALETHLLLAAHQARVDELMKACDPEWEHCEPEERDRWQRDRRLMSIAGDARAKRREKAHTMAKM